MAESGDNADGSRGPSAVKQELGQLRSDNEDLRAMVHIMKKRLEDMSSAQQGATCRNANRGESSEAGHAPGLPATEYRVGQL